MWCETEPLCVQSSPHPDLDDRIFDCLLASNNLYYILLNIYYTFIYPYLLYHNVIWGGTHVTALAPLIILPKKIVRLIAGQHFLAHTNPLFIRLKILKVDDLHKYKLALYMYCHTNNCARQLRMGYGTRHFQSFVPEFQRLAGTQRSLSYARPKVWNSLPASIRNIPRFGAFQSAVKNYYIESYSD